MATVDVGGSVTLEFGVERWISLPEGETQNCYNSFRPMASFRMAVLCPWLGLG